MLYFCLGSRTFLHFEGIQRHFVLFDHGVVGLNREDLVGQSQRQRPLFVLHLENQREMCSGGSEIIIRESNHYSVASTDFKKSAMSFTGGFVESSFASKSGT